ncbi:MAG: aminoglycoside 6-adenylyltransferase [Bacillota bacterium]
MSALLMLGSLTRTDHPADEWSDLTLILLVEDPRPYVASADWLARSADFWVSFTEAAGGGAPATERRVLFRGDLDVDMLILPEQAIEFALASGGAEAALFRDIVKRGYRVLVDKRRLMAMVRELLKERPGAAQASPELRHPTEAEFLQVVSDFLYHGIWTAKHLRRGELLAAKGCCDSHLKDLLRRMVEWHAQATHGWVAQETASRLPGRPRPAETSPAGSDMTAPPEGRVMDGARGLPVRADGDLRNNTRGEAGLKGPLASSLLRTAESLICVAGRIMDCGVWTRPAA